MTQHPAADPPLGDENGPLLKFFLGPVQTFIASARTVRDLWTGSYLLSWLTFAAMKPVLELVDKGEAWLVAPSVGCSPLQWTRRRQGPRPEGITTPCLPNHFTALLAKSVIASDLAQKCEKECENAWKTICGDVQKAINQKLSQRASLFEVEFGERKVDLLDPAWDGLWTSQVTSFFEIRTVVLAAGHPTPEAIDELLDPRPENAWEARMDVLAGMMDARKSVRHVPSYQAPGDVPQKCGLLGTYEQMGPAKLEESRKFWELFAKFTRIAGTRTEAAERLCAISLVKRFAWSTSLRFDLGNMNPRELRYSDTATIAAQPWLPADEKKKTPALDPERLWDEDDIWSGQWLHWPHQEIPEERKCPDEVWNIIEIKRARQGRPPTYYAVLMVDADRMGDKFRQSGGIIGSQAISAALVEFALKKIPNIVAGHQGEVIYSGGDDLLAVLPTNQVIACAQGVATEFKEHWREKKLEGEATLSAGIAVVHFKEDLRFALQTARDAEHLAKHSGRDALAVGVCRRSGEHTSAVLGWKEADTLQELVNQFKEVSDRWAYKLRAELPTLRGLPWAAVTAEVGRLLNRIESVASDQVKGFQKLVLTFLQDYHKDVIDRNSKADDEHRRSEAEILADFVTLCQSASFLARGRDAR